MKMFCFFVFVATFILTHGLSLPRNNSAVLISKYAKVARWGSSDNNTAEESGRSHITQSVWKPRSSHSSNVKNRVAYQYPVYKKVDEEYVEKIPGVGEVIQDRFQVRPYFGYGKTKDSELNYLPPNQKPADSAPIRQAPPPPPPPLVAPAPVASPQFLPSPVPPASFNIPLAASSTPQIPQNLYDSPFSSYNPPSDKNPDTNQNNYPPNPPLSDSNDNGDPSSSSGDSYASIPSSEDGIYNYQPVTNAPVASPKPSVMQNIDLSSYNGGKHHPSSYYDEVNHSYDYKPSDEKPSNSHGSDKAPNYPPKSINDVYYPPDFPQDQISDDQADSGMPVDMSHADMPMAPADMPKGNGEMDLVPPNHSNDFPKYLYDSHHYDHHVYEEVPHTTTTPAPEKKRVSTTNYSYYYLGRKLWYIPLYFSIYFMVYVTALIIKSIARHKVTLRNDWITANSRNARDLTFNHLETVDYIHKNVSIALDKAKKLYSDLSM